MKVIAILENDVYAGGGFNQALNAILQMKRLCDSRFEFVVFTTRSDNVDYLKKLEVDSVYFKFSVFDKLLAKLAASLWGQALQARCKVLGPFEKKLINSGCDLVYFVTPSGNAYTLQKLNYITTVWDLCHRDHPEFPEVRNFGQLRIRDRMLVDTLTSAYLILTDSKQLNQTLSLRYGIDEERLLAMPFGQAPFLDLNSSKSRSFVQKKYQLPPNYFFYPAQFWAHKNHVRILEALINLNAQGVRLDVVFAGGNQGNLAYIESLVARYNLEKQVKILGFVPTEDMRGLYDGCKAVVMPTYFGPTNLPPIEAWMTQRPLIYSSHLKAQVGNAAMLIDPDSAIDLANAMVACAEADISNSLIGAGRLRIKEIDRERAEAESALLVHMASFGARRKCWQ